MSKVLLNYLKLESRLFYFAVKLAWMFIIP